MSLKEIQKTIEIFLSSPQSEVLIIKGKWGVGKTYFWQDLIKHAGNDEGFIKNAEGKIDVYSLWV